MPRTALGALAGIVALGALLRFPTLDLQSFWYDEAVTVSLVREDLHTMLGLIPDTESTPPLYYVLAWLWARVLGEGEVGIRSLSAVLGTALVPASFAAVRRLTGSLRAGFIAALLAACSPILVWYSQEARAYSLVLLLATLTLLFFARLAPWEDDRHDLRALVGWSVFSALALLSHYFALFVVVPQAVWLLWRLRPLGPVLAAAGVVALTGAALLPLALRQESLELATFIREASILTRLGRLPKQLLLGFDAPAEVALGLLAMAVALAAAIFALRRPSAGVRTAAVLGGAAIAIPLVLSVAGVDYLDTRNVLPAWPLLAAVVAAGLARGRLGAAGAAVLCAIGIAGVVGVAAEPLWQRDDWRGAARALGRPSVPRAVLVSPGPTGYVPLAVYMPGARAMPEPGAPVQEIVFVTDRGPADGAHPSPPPRSRPPRIPGFSTARTLYAETYTALVLRAPAPRQVSPGQLRPFALTEGPPAALLVAPRGRRPPGG